MKIINNSSKAERPNALATQCVHTISLVAHYILISCYRTNKGWNSYSCGRGRIVHISSKCQKKLLQKKIHNNNASNIELPISAPAQFHTFPFWKCSCSFMVSERKCIYTHVGRFYPFFRPSIPRFVSPSVCM